MRSVIMSTVNYGMAIKKQEFMCDPDIAHLNHGSYGAVPKRVFDRQISFRKQMESHPDSWYRRTYPEEYASNVKALAEFINAKPQNLVLVENATTGVFCALNAMDFKSGDKLLVQSTTYHSVKVMARILKEKGVDVTTLEMKFPITSKEDIISQFQMICKKETFKAAIIDHITSPTAILMPVLELTDLLHSYDIKVIVDGAHSAGQTPLDFTTIQADMYAGNLHKWLFTPRGCGYLYINDEFRDKVVPAIPSHFHGYELAYDFCIRGTRDNTPFACIKEAIAFFQDIGGWSSMSTYNCNTLSTGIKEITEAWKTDVLPVDESLCAPYMRLIRVPEMPNYPKTHTGAGDLDSTLYKRFKVQIYCMLVEGEIYVRVSSNVYANIEDFRRLRDAILELQQEQKVIRTTGGYELPIVHWDLTSLAEII